MVWTPRLDGAVVSWSEAFTLMYQSLERVPVGRFSSEPPLLKTVASGAARKEELSMIC